MTPKPVLRYLSLIVPMLIGSWTARGATVQWTNAAGGNWTVAENWEPNQVPAGSDTAIITNAGVYTVVLNSGSATVDGLILGGHSGGQTLALEGGEFTCSNTVVINPGSQLNVADSWLHTFRTEVAGNLIWQSGIVDGTLVVTTNGTLNITGENDKFLRDGTAVTNYGLIQWSGLGGLYSQNSSFTGESPFIVNTPGGVFEIQSDTALGVPPLDLDPVTLVFQNAGLLRKAAGSGTTPFVDVNFANSGTVQIDEGTLLFFSANGTPPAWTSSGLFTVSAGAAVQLSAGNCTFLPGHLAQGEGTFGINAIGSLTLNGEIGGKLDWAQGIFNGRLTIATNGVLNISGAAEKQLWDGSAITNYGLIQWSGVGSLYGEDFDFIADHPTIINMPGGVFEIQSDAALGLSPSGGFDPFLTVVFQNSGLLRKVAGSGTTPFVNVNFVNSGTVEVEQGTLLFFSASGTPPAWTSSGVFTVSAGAAVQLSAGNCTFLPGHLAQGEGSFGFSAMGSLTLNGEIAGKLDWGQGTFDGHLTIASNGVLNILGDAEKRIWDGSAITNYGLIQWSGSGPLYGDDFDFIADHPMIVNMAGAVFEIQSDTAIGSPGSFDPLLALVFQNAGLVRKVAGAGTTTFINVNFVNSGTVEVEQGTLLFFSPNGVPPDWTSSGLFTVSAGAAVQLGAGNCTFLPGHLAQGEGSFGFSAMGSLTLNGEIAGKLDWTQGSFNGRLTIATNGVLNIFGDAEKRIWDGSAITNYGLIQWSGSGALNGAGFGFTFDNPAIINMAGAVFEIQSDTSMSGPADFDPLHILVFENAGLVRKVAGPGTTTFINVNFVNSGTVAVEQGTLLFFSPNGVPPDWTSSGLFTVSAGAAVQLGAGNCTFLPGHLAQGEGLFELSVMGALTLNGEIAGKLDWRRGYFDGRLTIATNGVLNIFGDEEKQIWDGAAITNYGLIQWSGSGALYNVDFDYIADPPTILNMAGGVFEIQNDTSIGTSWNFDPLVTMVFRNEGLVRKVAGAGTTTFLSVNFVNSGTVEVEQGTLLFFSPNGVPPAWASSGLFTVSAGAAVQLGAGNCTFLPGHLAQGEGSFGFTVMGSLTLNGEIAGKLDWTRGNLDGRLTIATNGVLNIFGDEEKRLSDGAAITNYGLIQWSGSGALYSTDFDSVPGNPTIINKAGAVFEIQNDTVLGLPWSGDPLLTMGFQNDGLLRKVAGPGTTTFANVNFANSGTVQVEQGILLFTSGDIVPPPWTSSGLFTASAGATVQYGGGNCTFLPGHRAQGAGSFVVSVTGVLILNGEIADQLDWISGGFDGQLTIASNGVLNIFGDVEKRLLDGVTITNYGVIQWSGSGALYTADFDGNPNHPTIANMAGAVFEIQNDTVLGSQSSPDADTRLAFQNAGLLRKVAGAGAATTFASVDLLNLGTLEVGNGLLNLDSGSTWIDNGSVDLAASSPASYSRVDSFGITSLSGELKVEFLNGYLPVGGDAFELLTYHSTNVAFTSINLPVLSAGLYFSTLVDTQHLVVEVRQDPIANPDNFPLVEDTPADLDVLANDQYLYGPGSIESFSQPSHALVSLNPDNTLHYAPALNYFGADSFSYTARNADGRLGTATVTLTISGVNDAPVFAAVPNQTVDEMSRLILQLAATDVDQDVLGFALVSGPAGVTVFPNGALHWTPSEVQGPSTNQIVVRVFDNGSPSLSATQVFSVVVNEVNSAPVLAPMPDATVSPGQTLNLTFSATDFDWPANTVTFSLQTAPSGASLTSGGAFSWTPGFDQAGRTNILVVKAIDNGAPPLAATGSFSVVVTDAGLKGDYFNGTNFDTLALTRAEPQIDFDWASSSPGPGVAADQFSARWTGRIVPLYSQTYTFSTISDDGVRLWINGFPIIDNWTVHLTTTNTGVFALTAGQPCQIKLEYFEGSGPAVCRLLWSSPSQPAQIVPAAQLLGSGYSNVIGNAIYRFTPKVATGKCMEVKSGATADGSETEISNFNNKLWEKWQALDAGNGYFKLVPQHAPTKVLEINGGFTTNGTRVQISTDTGSARQHFRFVDMGQGWFKIQPESAPASVIQVKGGGNGNGVPVELFEDNATVAQRWRLDRQ